MSLVSQTSEKWRGGINKCVSWLIKIHVSKKRKVCMKTIRSVIFSRQRQTLEHNALDGTSRERQWCHKRCKKEEFTMIQRQGINTSSSRSENTVLGGAWWHPTQTITQWLGRRVYRTVWYPTTMVSDFTCNFMWSKAFKIWWEVDIYVLPTGICSGRKMSFSSK